MREEIFMQYKEISKITTPPRLAGYSYTLDEVKEARDNGKLLCLRLDTNYICNLKCRYCYSYEQHKENAVHMPFEFATQIIDQACDLGLKSIVYLGGG